VSSSPATRRVNDQEKSLYSRVKLGRNYNSKIVAVFDLLGRAESFVKKETQTNLVFGVVFTISFTVALSTNIHKR